MQIMSEDTPMYPTHTLEQLFTQYGSDKHVNGYTPVYESLFKHARTQARTVVEIGIGTMIEGVYSSMVGYAQPGYKPGGSLRAWRDYFPHAEVHGIDVQPDTQFTDEARITTHLCDTTNKEASEALQAQDAFPSPGTVDILIDDGAHGDDQQLNTFYHFYRSVRAGGFYIIEDIFPGSRIMTEYLPKIREFARDGRVFAAFLTDDLGGELNGGRTPILIISK